MSSPSSRCSGSRSSHQFQSRASPPPAAITRCSSGRARSRSNQWNACPAKAASTLASGSGIASAGASSASASGTARPELLEHRGARLDGHDVEAERDEAARQLPRPGADVEDAARRARARAAPAAQRSASSGYSGRCRS